MGFVGAGLIQDFGSKQMMSVKVGDRDVVIVRLGGNYYAIGNRCTHAGCQLSGGALNGEGVRCPCHGSVFSVVTGDVVNGPAKKPEPSYQVRIEGDQILVSI